MFMLLMVVVVGIESVVVDVTVVTAVVARYWQCCLNQASTATVLLLSI